MKIREIIKISLERTKENWKKLVQLELVTILVLLALKLLETVVNRGDRTSIGMNLVLLFFCCVGIIFTGGTVYGFMKAAVREKVQLKDIIFVFQYDIINYLAIQIKMILMAAAAFLFIGLMFVNFLFFAYQEDTAFIISYILTDFIWILFRFRYFLSVYLLLDGEEDSSKWALKRSARMMEGNYFRLICLKLSFLPMILLSVLTCGIGFLFVLPWMGVADALFYLDLICKDKMLEKQSQPGADSQSI